MVRAAGSPGNPPGAGSWTSVSIQRHLQLRCRSPAAVPRHMGPLRRPPSPREPVLPGAPPRRRRGAVAGQLHRPGKRSRRPCVGRGRACIDPAPRHPNWPPRSPPFTTSAARRTGCASSASAAAEHERRSDWMWPSCRAERESVPAIDRANSDQRSRRYDRSASRSSRRPCRCLEFENWGHVPHVQGGGDGPPRTPVRSHRIRALPQQPARIGRNRATPRGQESRGGETWDMGVDAAVDWWDRAGVVEGVIRRRYLRHLLGVVPGTRIGRVRWPRPLFVRPWPWHYWWQAHLLDCLVDAQRRAPNPARAIEIAALARTVRLRNFGSWTNDYYDDIAWFGLAVQRAGPLARRSTPSALAAITARLQGGWTPAGGGGIWWRRGDNFKNAPANGPAAILAARVGNVEFAAAITDWMTATLLDPESGLVRDGVRLNPDGSIRTVETTTYTYCQGVYLGACIELAERDGHPRWAERAGAVLDAIAARMAES